MSVKWLKLYLPVFVLINLCLVSNSQSGIKVRQINAQYNNKKVFVYQIAQESSGCIWMTSREGILKYNGYSFSLIENTEIFPSISPDDDVERMYSDSLQNIWIKTKNGLVCKYNSKKGVHNDISSLAGEPINSIKPAKGGLLMVTDMGRVLTFFDDKIEHIFSVPDSNNKGFSSNNIELVGKNEIFVSNSFGKIYNYSLVSKKLTELVGPYTNYPGFIPLESDANGKLWIGTEAQGLFVYDIHEKKFIQNGFLTGQTNHIHKELFSSIFCDSNGFIWAGTDGGGLYKINSTSGNIIVYKQKYPNEFSLGSNTIMNISEDIQNNIWIVTNYGNVNVIPKPNRFVHYHKGSISDASLRVLSIYKSSKGTLWIGTDGNGLTRIEKNRPGKEYFNDIDNNFYIQSITEDDKSHIWLGTYRHGLWMYNTDTDTFKKIPVVNKKGQNATDVRSVFTDSRGRIWAGSNVALNVYSSNQELIASFENDENGLNGIIVESILEDQNNTIWIGQYNAGLLKLNENKDNLGLSSFVDYTGTSSRALDMCLGKSNEIWFLDENFNLNLYNSQTETFSNFRSLFPNKENDFKAILAQDETNLWLSSNQGIHHFNTDEKSINTFYATDGFQGDTYMLRSKFKESDSLIYFGGPKGFNYFNPKKIKKTSSDAHLSIISIDILNKPAKDIIPDQIASGVYNIENLRLKNSQSSFSIKFSAIGNILNPSYNYSYRLKGFEEDWMSTYAEGLATYTNIPSGSYTFEIKANEINQPSEILQKQLNITIAPPFWKSSWAYLAYAIILSVMALFIIKWSLLRKKLLINKIVRRKEKELHKAKMNFFTKMSHEIQTPITLILGPIQDMIKQAEMNGNLLLKQRLNIISNNATRLSRIARELTLTRDKELDRLKLTVAQNNLYTDIEKISTSFKELARSKHIDFSVSCPKNLYDTWYDKEKLEHILYNILANAFKFTPKEGNIQLNIKPLKNKQFAKISVSDSGAGIPKNELNDIFKLFYRSNNKTKGTGIGLALTKELVDLHKGKIKVNSSESDGTTFTIKLPISEDLYDDDEKITSSKKTTQAIQDSKIPENPTNINSTKKTILIVEDNFELQDFLKDLLIEQYNILLAENGKEGFYHAKNNIPDLILSDIMMPEMDGVELCDALSEDSLTQHIPVILLTAKNSTNAKIEGLKAGAIEYINKPFNTSELLLKVNNILSTNDSIISKYRKELINRPSIDVEKSQDEIFLEHLSEIVNERLHDPSFKVDELAEKLSMSHSSLYRKCSSLTGSSLIDYIRQIRLKKAAILLAKYGYTISEVAYRVGFNNPKYFSKSFKAHFQMTPKDFKNKARNSNNMDTYLKENNVDVNSYSNT